MDSLSVGIRVPSIDCDGETWTRVNTGPRNDLFFPDALLSASRRVAGIRLEWWPPSNRNSGRDQIGIPGRLALEFAMEQRRTIRLPSIAKSSRRVPLIVVSFSIIFRSIFVSSMSQVSRAICDVPVS
jgi:hypothetical protein